MAAASASAWFSGDNYYSNPEGSYFIGSSVLREKVYGAAKHKRCYHMDLACARKRAKKEIVAEFEKQYAIDNGRKACKICCPSPVKGGKGGKGSKDGKGGKDGKGKGKDGGEKGGKADKGGKDGKGKGKDGGEKGGKGDKQGAPVDDDNVDEVRRAFFEAVDASQSSDATDRLTQDHGFGSDHSCWDNQY